jgi:hypothetical protein
LYYCFWLSQYINVVIYNKFHITILAISFTLPLKPPQFQKFKNNYCHCHFPQNQTILTETQIPHNPLQTLILLLLHHHHNSLPMDSIGVLMTCPMFDYLEQRLQNRFNLFKLWTYSSNTDFFKNNSHSIRAIVGDTKIGADAELIDSLPRLEIVSSFSVGLDKIDLRKCQQKGIRVTNTPDVLTDDVADTAIGLVLAVMRRLCECDRFVRSGLWKKCDFRLATKVKF